MEVMFYIIAGKFNPSNDDFPVKTLITKDKFADKYAQDCTNLLDEQDIFNIIDKLQTELSVSNHVKMLGSTALLLKML